MAGKMSRRSICKKSILFSWLKIILICVLLLPASYYSLLFRYSWIFSKDVPNQYFVLSITTTFENDSPQGRVWNFSDTEKTVGLFMNNSWQTIYLLNVSSPVNEVQIDVDGNPVATLSFPKSKILRGENFTFQISS